MVEMRELAYLILLVIDSLEAHIYRKSPNEMLYLRLEEFQYASLE
jgi:hypothetical protein